MNHRIGRSVFALVVGGIAAYASYQWVTNPAPRAERNQEEQIVFLSRRLLVEKIDVAEPQIVDPLAPQRKVGKAYVYREGDGWAVSGYYRRDDSDRWHPYLMLLDSELRLERLKLADEQLLERAASDETLDVLP